MIHDCFRRWNKSFATTDLVLIEPCGMRRFQLSLPTVLLWRFIEFEGNSTAYHNFRLWTCYSMNFTYKCSSVIITDVPEMDRKFLIFIKSCYLSMFFYWNRFLKIFAKKILNFKFEILQNSNWFQDKEFLIVSEKICVYKCGF